MKKLLIIFLFMTSTFFYSTSAKKNISDSNNPKDKIMSLIELSEKYFTIDKDSAYAFSQKAIKIAKKIENYQLFGKALYSRGYNYYRMNELDSARIVLERSLKVFENIADSINIGSTLNLLGNTYWYLDKQLQSRNTFEKALEVNKKVENDQAIGKSYNNLGNFYSQMGNYEKAIDAFTNSRNFFIRAGYLEGEAWLNYSLAVLYKRLEDYNAALDAIQLSLEQYKEISKNTKDSTGLVICYNQLGDIFRLLGQPEKGLVFLEKSLKLRKKTGIAVAYSLTGIGKCYYQMKEYDLAEEYMQRALKLRTNNQSKAGMASNLLFLGYIAKTRGENDKALKFLKKSLKYARERNKPLLQSEIVNEMAKIQVERKNYKTAIVLSEKYESIQDSLYSINISKKAASLMLQHKIEKQNAEKNRLQKINSINQLKLSRSKTLRYILIIAIVSLLFVITITFFIYQKQLKIKSLKKMIPICANCKRIRTDSGYYEQAEEYFAKHSDIQFTQSLCPECSDQSKS